MEILTYKGYRDADFHVRLESASPEFLYMHCEVYNWNKTVLKRMYRVFVSIAEEAKSAGFKELRTVSPNPKFTKLFDFESIGEVTYGNQEYKVMKWDLNLL
jgi:hypothetical protein